MTSAIGPLVIQFFVPLITQLVAVLRRAVVFCAAASEPASGSVSAKQPSILPARERREPLLLLLVGAELEDRVADERVVARS